MKNLLIASFLFITTNAIAMNAAHYKVLPGSLHKKGNVVVTVLPSESTFDVEMDYNLKKKPLVPVSNNLLKGKKVYHFPLKFKSEEGYRELEKTKTMMIPKAELKFVKKGNFGNLKNAYFIQVLPTNKKSKIDIVYHPSLSSVGWANIQLTFLMPIPIINGYKVEAEITK